MSAFRRLRKCGERKKRKVKYETSVKYNNGLHVLVTLKRATIKSLPVASSYLYYGTIRINNYCNSKTVVAVQRQRWRSVGDAGPEAACTCSDRQQLPAQAYGACISGNQLM